MTLAGCSQTHGVLSTVCVLVLVTELTGAFYHLASPSHPCHVTAQENDTVDVICQYKEGFVTSSRTGNSLACVSQTAVWQRTDYRLLTNLSDSGKYGVWEAAPGWRIAERQRISLLRVRRLQPEDLGLYQCRLQCLTEDRVHINLHMASLCLQQAPGYSICAAGASDTKCSWTFANGICDRECDNEENLYDGFDCSPPVAACQSAAGADSCRLEFANGVCDSECDSRACVWDGGDCIDKPLVFAADTIMLSLAPWYQRTGKTVDVKEVGRVFSRLLRTIVRVMPEDWPGTRSRDRDVSWHRPDRRGYDSVRRIYLKIDNTMCQRKCFHTADSAAKFIDLSLKNKWDPGTPITAIGILSRTVNQCELENNTLLHIDLPTSPQKDPVHNIYSYTYAESSESGLPPTWLLVTATIGGVVVLTLVIVIIVIILRIRKLSKEERHRAVADIHLIQDKGAPQGTDV